MYFLGVDSGGTKTAFVLSDEKGRINGRYYSSGGDFIRRSEAEISVLIHEGIEMVCRNAGIAKTEIDYAVFGFPGYGETESSAKVLEDICAAELPAGRITCANDSVIAWAGSLAMKPGINIIAGTGSICFGMDAKGNTARTGGWGAYCDEGSCQWIGNQALGIFTKQSDGRLEKTALYSILKKYFGLEEDLLFCHILNTELASEVSSLAKIQLLVKEAYELGDPYARELYEKAADELWLAIETAAKKLDFPGGRYSISYSGGLFQSGECILGPLRKKAEKLPVVFSEPRFTPDIGAVLMAMKMYGSTVDFETITFN